MSPEGAEPIKVWGRFREAATLIMTDATCVIGGTSYSGIPTIVWRDGTIEEAGSDWLRYQVLTRARGLQTAKEYAKILRLFLTFCRRDRRRWEDVDDAFLIRWRDSMRRKLKLGSNRTNTCLIIVFAFYRWVEREWRLRPDYWRFRVGVYDADELPAQMRQGYRFPITAIKKRSKGGGAMWVTPLTLPTTRQSSGTRSTPTEEQTRELHAIATQKRTATRDTLILSCAEETGARRADALGIKTNDIPSIEKIYELIDCEQIHRVQVIGKGGKVRNLLFSPDLLIRMANYIHEERAITVATARKRDPSYRESPHLFLSESTGQVLHPDSLTKLAGELFRAADISDASFHRLRAKFLLGVVETLIDARLAEGPTLSEESILTQAAEMAGHANVESLRPYLNFSLNRRARASDAYRAHDAAARVRELERQEQAARHRLAQNSEIKSAIRLLDEGRRSEAAAQLRRIADQLESGSPLKPGRGRRSQ
jgi:integrase